MSLPSQGKRIRSGRTNMYRARNLPIRAMTTIGLVAVATVVIWVVVAGDDDATPERMAINTSETTDTQRRSSDDAKNDRAEPESEITEPGGAHTPDLAPPPAVVTRPAPTTAMKETTPQTEQARDETMSDTTTPPVGIEESTLPPASESSAGRRAVRRMNTGLDLIRDNRPLEARRMLTMAYESGELNAQHAQETRDALNDLNDRLVFSPEIVPGDPFAMQYTIQSGDTLAKIRKKNGLAIDWRLLARINRIANPRNIRIDQRIKLLTGPFHAVVNKRDYRMDIYMGEDNDRVFVRSFDVGLGEFNATPLGVFKVRTDSKLINPEWANPRTGEKFEPDDPMNPIGEHWLGLEGLSEHVRDLKGYGIHGTIEPNSIGKQESMGCVRLVAEDIELVYELLTEEASLIEIVPE
ncbi:MAG: L,D-transpeptidase family protein [Planctomycetota bacterium]